ncbi:DUF192 domain-containing protein [Patescibacteria group bacterium]|nr:DUF192 domain-containing protein [Patescibacteria group bacterium]
MARHKKYLKYWHQYWHLTLLLLVVSLVSLLYLNVNHYRSLNVKAGVCNFQADVADTSSKQYQGLSGRKWLAKNEAMLFLFPQASDRTFVMRRMNFPLDIVFIRDHKIINLYHDLLPEGDYPRSTYHSGLPADAVLEIPAGASRDCRLGVGVEIYW